MKNQSIVEIPAMIDGALVVEIGENCFAGNETIQKVSFPASVQVIGPYAFAESTVEEIEIENTSIKRIETGAFSLSNIKTITLPVDLEFLGDAVFYECGNLTSAHLSERLYEIPAYCFFECDSLETVVLSMCVDRIQDYAFYGCRSLEEIVFSDKLISIGESAFECSGIREAVFPEGFIMLMDHAFLECEDLIYCELPLSIEYIGEDVFGDCENLTLGVYEESYGYEYAMNHNIPYKLLEPEE